MRPATFCGVRPGIRLAEDAAAKRQLAVARAFDEMNARHLREAFDVVERERRRTIDESVHEQRVLRRIDARHAGVVSLEVKIRRRDRAARDPAAA